jgi:hypothetical protein
MLGFQEGVTEPSVLLLVTALVRVFGPFWDSHLRMSL